MCTCTYIYIYLHVDTYYKYKCVCNPFWKKEQARNHHIYMHRHICVYTFIRIRTIAEIMVWLFSRPWLEAGEASAMLPCMDFCVCLCLHVHVVVSRLF